MTASFNRLRRCATCHTRRAPFSIVSVALLTISASFITGCASLSMPRPSDWFSRSESDELGIDASGAKKRLAGGDPLFEDDSDVRRIDDVVGPLQRKAMARARSGRLTSTSDKNDQEKLRRGLVLFEDKKYQDAETVFAALVKKRGPKKFTLFSDDDDRTKYDPVREEAVFFLAETHFMQGKLAKADSHYKALIKDYPSTRYLDQSTRRLFDISRRWLGVDDFASSGEIRQVSLEDGGNDAPLSNLPKKPKRRFGFLPNLTDSSRPVLDHDGHALASLKAIWMNDPSGPLADDALMLAATHRLRTEDYRDADRLLTILREQYPKSTHLQTAFVLGSHVKLMSYQGSKYDERLLEDARDLKESTLRLFPDLPESDRVRSELKMIHDARAKRDWDTVIFYEKKHEPKAVAVYCREILRNFPNTQYGQLARRKLAEIQSGNTVAAAPPAGNQLPRQTQQEPPLQPFQSVPEIPDNDGPVFEPSAPIFDDDSSPAETPQFEEPDFDRSADNNVGRVRLKR